MRKRLTIFTTNLSRLAAIVILAIGVSTEAVDGYIPLDKKHIKLSDGREVFSIRTGVHSHKVILKNGQKTLWEKNYEEEYDRLWDHAFFVPIKPGHYSYDLNNDGSIKIAIATWDGGIAMDHRTAVIFSVKANSLEYYCTHEFNLEYGRYVYP